MWYEVRNVLSLKIDCWSPLVAIDKSYGKLETFYGNLMRYSDERRQRISGYRSISAELSYLSATLCFLCISL